MCAYTCPPVTYLNIFPRKPKLRIQICPPSCIPIGIGHINNIIFSCKIHPWCIPLPLQLSPEHKRLWGMGSPVPPAVSSRRVPGRGFIMWRSVSFHIRWMPRLMASFITSYFWATLSNTLYTDKRTNRQTNGNNSEKSRLQFIRQKKLCRSQAKGGAIYSTGHMSYLYYIILQYNSQVYQFLGCLQESILQATQFAKK